MLFLAESIPCSKRANHTAYQMGLSNPIPANKEALNSKT